jgi:hypothetical protein
MVKFTLKNQTISESDRCVTFFKEMQYRMLTMENPPILYHIANEHMMGRSKDYIGFLMKLLRMGMRKGVFDYIAHTKDKIVYIEFKTEKGKLSSNQQVFAEDLIKKDIPYLVTTDIDKAIKFLLEHFS